MIKSGISVQDLPDYSEYPALKLRYTATKPSASSDLVDVTGNLPNSAPQGALAPWTVDSELDFATQNAYAASFTAINTTNAGVQACYPINGTCVLVHALIRPTDITAEAGGILSFGGGYTMGNSGAPNGNGGAFGVAVMVSTGRRLTAWMRDASSAVSPTAWQNAQGMGTIPTLDNRDLNDGMWHSIQVLFMPNKSQTSGRQGWILGWIDGEECSMPRPWAITTGITPGASPTGVGYQFTPLFHPRNTGATNGRSFKGGVREIQLWRFNGIPDDIDQIIRDLNAQPRRVPERLRGRNV